MLHSLLIQCNQAKKQERGNDLCNIKALAHALYMGATKSQDRMGFLSNKNILRHEKILNVKALGST